MMMCGKSMLTHSECGAGEFNRLNGIPCLFNQERAPDSTPLLEDDETCPIDLSRSMTEEDIEEDQ